MTTIDLADLDASLAADIAADTDETAATDWTAHEAEYEGATVSNQRWQIVHSATHHRGGIVFVGSGSSGHPMWTDADTPEQVLARHHADEMVN